MKYCQALSSVALCLSAAVLSGCVALALAPAAVYVGGLVNGSRESAVNVTIDETTFSSEIRTLLANSKSLAISTSGRAGVKAADLFETRGGYQVTIDRSTSQVGELTGSERRDTLRKLCSGSRADVAMLGRISKTESNNMWTSVMTGRAKIKTEWIEDLLDCRTNKAMSFGGTFEFDAGIYSPKSPSELEEIIGAEIGGKILDAIGRNKLGQIGQPTTTEPIRNSSPSNNENATRSAEGASTSAKSQPFAGSQNVAAMSVAEVQKRLFELGYAVGTADGVMGKRTVDALKIFQRASDIPATGRIDVETTNKLRTSIGGK